MRTVDELAGWLKELQDKICNGLSELDGKENFKEDNWTREEGGGGRSRILENGKLFEKGGVNFSHVYGKTPSFLQSENKHSISVGADSNFSVTGLSIVIHPQNPWVPIIHMNIRYFELDNGTYWFGGGIDLTPHFYDKKQYDQFHGAIKKMCEKFHPDFYKDFSRWADEYFYLPHRKETRGIGGIFFDRIKADDKISKATILEFWKATGELFLPLYTELVRTKMNLSFTDQDKKWQHIRRGRYVEFNLLYDRGTRFGLETGGRTESILMSLPQHASWFYNYKPLPGSEEEKTIAFLSRSLKN